MKSNNDMINNVTIIIVSWKYFNLTFLFQTNFLHTLQHWASQNSMENTQTRADHKTVQIIMIIILFILFKAINTLSIYY